MTAEYEKVLCPDVELCMSSKRYWADGNIIDKRFANPGFRGLFDKLGLIYASREGERYLTIPSPRKFTGLLEEHELGTPYRFVPSGYSGLISNADYLASWKRKEFPISYDPDYRFHDQVNHGLGVLPLDLENAEIIQQVVEYATDYDPTLISTVANALDEITELFFNYARITETSVAHHIIKIAEALEIRNEVQLSGHLNRSAMVFAHRYLQRQHAILERFAA